MSAENHIIELTGRIDTLEYAVKNLELEIKRLRAMHDERVSLPGNIAPPTHPPVEPKKKLKL